MFVVLIQIQMSSCLLERYFLTLSRLQVCDTWKFVYATALPVSAQEQAWDAGRAQYILKEHPLSFFSVVLIVVNSTIILPGIQATNLCITFYRLLHLIHLLVILWFFCSVSSFMSISSTFLHPPPHCYHLHSH